MIPQAIEQQLTDNGIKAGRQPTRETRGDEGQGTHGHLENKTNTGTPKSKRDQTKMAFFKPHR